MEMLQQLETYLHNNGFHKWIPKYNPEKNIVEVYTRQHVLNPQVKFELLEITKGKDAHICESDDRLNVLIIEL